MRWLDRTAEWSALQAAVELQDTRLVEMLLARGMADPARCPRGTPDLLALATGDSDPAWRVPVDPAMVDLCRLARRPLGSATAHLFSPAARHATAFLLLTMRRARWYLPPECWTLVLAWLARSHLPSVPTPGFSARDATLADAGPGTAAVRANLSARATAPSEPRPAGGPSTPRPAPTNGADHRSDAS